MKKDYASLPKRAHFEYYKNIETKHGNDWFEVLEITENIYAICEPRHEQNGCFYLVAGKKMGLLFDTGLGVYDPRPVIEELYSGSLIVYNSHFHFDHTGGNHFFDGCHIKKSDIAEKIANQGLFTPVIKAQMRDEAFLTGRPTDFDQAAYGTRPFRPVWVNEGEIIDLGDFQFEVLFAPGHSPDGIVLFEKKRNIMLMGDTFYLGALYCQFASEEFGYSDIRDYRDTMHRLAKLADRNTLLLCSHNACAASGEKLAEAAALFDQILCTGDSGEGNIQHDFDYGQSGELRQLEGDGFSVMYTPRF